MKASARALVLVLGGAACGGRVIAPRGPVPASPPKSAAVAASPRDSVVLPSAVPHIAIDLPASVLTRQAVGLVGDPAVIQLADSSAPEGPTWDIDVRSYGTHRRVEFYVNLFTGSSREHFVSQLEKGSRYEPMIREKLRAARIPEDMYYLVLVESGFDQHAY